MKCILYDYTTDIIFSIGNTIGSAISNAMNKWLYVIDKCVLCDCTEDIVITMGNTIGNTIDIDYMSSTNVDYMIIQ